MNYEVFHDHLRNDLISFWNKMADRENGGFYGCADKNGLPDKNSAKGVIMTGRILWFYSYAYRLLKDPGLLEMADHAYRFFAEHCFDSRYGGVFWSVNADGSPCDDTKHAYNQAFAVYALSAYYQASGNRNALDLAYTLYHTVEEKCRDENGYLEAFARDFTPVSNDKLSENGVMADRTTNTHLHVLESYTELYKADGSPAVGSSVREVMRLFKSRLYNYEKKRLEVFFDKDFHSLIDLESFGHDIEASWLIDRGCAVLGDTDLRGEMLPIINGLAEGAYLHGIDSDTHAMNNECENGKVNRTKIWWVQAESVIGFYNAYQNDPGNTEYLHSSERVWEYIQKYVIDPNSGEWIENIEPDNTFDPNQALVHSWKCPYHNGRMCIEMIRRLSSGV